MRQTIRFGISQKFLVMLLLTALIPVLAIWSISYRTIHAQTSEKVLAELTAANSELIAQVNAWVDMNERMLRYTAGLPAISSMDAEAQTPVLESVARHYPWIYLAFTVDARGNNIARSDGEALRSYADRDYFRQVMDGRPFGKQVLIGRTSGQPAMVLATAIQWPDGRTRGVVAQAMTLADLSSLIVGRRIGTTGFSFLVDENNEVVAHPDSEMTTARSNLGSHPALAALRAGQSQSLFDERGERVIAVAGRATGGWTMVTQQSHAEAYRVIRAEAVKASVILLLTVLAVIAVAWIVSRWLTAPIVELTEAAEKYSVGETDLKLSGLHRKDEIGHLSQAIERLGTSIRIAMNRLKAR